MEFIRHYNLKALKFPIPIAFMGRKQSVDFNDTTLETWKTFIPQKYYTLKAHDKEIIIMDTVKIQYGGFDKQESMNKFQSAEYCFLFIDQAEELTRTDYGFAQATLRRKINNQPVKYKTLLTANPADNWLKEEFVTRRESDTAYIKSLPADNPFLAENYVGRLEKSFKHRPELLKAYIEGDWDVLAGDFSVIKSIWIDEAIENHPDYTDDDRMVVSCDVARFGKDETVIYVFKGHRVVDEIIYGQKSTMDTAGHIARLSRQYNSSLNIVDGDGVGGGVCDRLREIGISVYEIHSASKAEGETQEEEFINLRAQMWFYAAQLFEESGIHLHNDTKLRNQLASVQYSVHSSGRLKVEAKEDLIKRIDGESPDRADAFIYGLWGLKHVISKKVEKFRAVVANYKPPVSDRYGWTSGRKSQSLRRFAHA